MIFDRPARRANAADGGPPGRDGYLRVALVLSLAANVFVAGLVFGGRLAGPPPGDGPLSDRVEAQLSAEGWRRIAPLMAETDAAFAGGPAADPGFRAAHAALAAAVRAEPFDEAAARRALSAMSAARADRDALLADRLVAMLAALDAGDREALVATLLARPPHP